MIRLTAIRLENFKNVGSGRIVLSSVGPDPDAWDADIVGIYGQNGSGKTSVITALRVVKALWGLGSLPEGCAEYLALGQGSFTVAVEGIASPSAGGFPACSFEYEARVSAPANGARVSGEVLTWKNLQADKPTTKTVLEYSSDSDDGAVRPKVAWSSLCAMGRDVSTDFTVALRMVGARGGSLLFSDELSEVLQNMIRAYGRKDAQGTLSEAARRAYDDVLLPAIALESELCNFAVGCMAVVTPSRQADPMLNLLRISTHAGSAKNLADAYLQIDIRQPSVLKPDEAAALRATVSTISVVMGALVPGFSLGVSSLGAMMADDGGEAERVEIVAKRGDVAVPLRAESEGIKKLVSILVLLVDVYAKPEACIAIDELDSGVFEFLLGEVLQVLQDHGRGQLVFTAHNLRPLETLDKMSLVFTTTNPQNRYVTFQGLKATNNLRDQYLRAINLGGQPETIYEPTSKYEIDGAFYDAAHPGE